METFVKISRLNRYMMFFLLPAWNVDVVLAMEQSFCKHEARSRRLKPKSSLDSSWFCEVILPVLDSHVWTCFYPTKNELLHM